ncbi:MAG: hypothetical protein IKA37_05320, partial [Spirochaetales bacterium]|nr:hypothetical protein [Spirochaetales bacterium]
SRKNVLTWLMALCLTASAVARIVFACMKGTEESENVWCRTAFIDMVVRSLKVVDSLTKQCKL